jgi:hypothetical protein
MFGCDPQVSEHLPNGLQQFPKMARKAAFDSTASFSIPPQRLDKMKWRGGPVIDDLIHSGSRTP